MSAGKTPAVVSLLAVAYNLDEKDFSSTVLEKLVGLEKETVSLVFTYTVKKVSTKKNARAGYIFKTIDQAWYKALDIASSEKAKEKADIIDRLAKTKIVDLGREELIKIAAAFNRVVSTADETETIRAFVLDKVKRAKELEEAFVRFFSR